MSEQAEPVKNKLAPMPVGGAVIAVVPQSVEEIQRVSNMVIAAGIAPASLTYRPKNGDSEDYVKSRNIAAVATAIMAGAELGLPPLVALRSFTVINGRPALYADGNVAVVRKAKDRDGALICAGIQHGYVEVCDYICPACGTTHKSEGLALTHFIVAHNNVTIPDGHKLEFERTGPTDRSFAWCEARRADTGEVHREEFSVADAKQAGLWDERDEVERDGWEGEYPNRKKVRKLFPNDAPWHRFPKRMMLWRAAGYCLRWLFADVLGGMPDEYEARDIEAMIDITPTSGPARRAAPPAPPAEEEEPLHISDQQDGAENEAPAHTETIAEPEEQAPEEPEDDPAPPAPQTKPPVPPNFDDLENDAVDTSDEGRFLSELDRELGGAKDVHELFDLYHSLGGTDNHTPALAIYDKHRERIERAELEAAGQESMFPGDAPAQTKRKK